MRRLTQAFVACAALGAMASDLPAQDKPIVPSVNLYGVPGLLDMPSGESLPGGEIAFTVGNFAGMTRGTLGFQANDWLFGSFRYTQILDWNSSTFGTYYDRSFDLRFRLLDESEWLPSVTLGLQDFIGTGIYSAEYFAATKNVADTLAVTAGLGWGRLGSADSIGSTGTRPDRDIDEGGTPHPDTWFRGDVGLFGGLVYKPIPDLALKAEYSTDNYDIEEDRRDVFDQRSRFNFGAEYQLSRDIRLGAYYMYGSELGLSAQILLNPAYPPYEGIRDNAPPPVLPRPSRTARPEFYTTEWVEDVEVRDQVETLVTEGLIELRIEVEALRLTADNATIYIRNRGYLAEAQAIGRTARVMSRVMPSSIETFTIILTRNGLPLPALTFRRDDVEQFEVSPDGAEAMLARADVNVDPGQPLADEIVDGFYPRFSWDILPYTQFSAFDPDNPLRADLGVQLDLGYEFRPGVIFGSNFRKKVIGNLDENERDSNSELPRVRSDFAEYDRNGDPWIDELYGAYYFTVAPETYGRLTAGYLERMFAGVSSEVLWAPYETSYAFGAELNYVYQRDFNGGFGLQDYDVLTGHATAYWKFLPEYQAELSVGRYLAGDYGATIGLQRVFENGWALGAFATFTDVSADEFGEGSFDKGITLRIPLEWMIGRSTRQRVNVALRPVTRDGGAVLNVPGRLFGVVNDGLRREQVDQWDRFWR